MVFAKEYHSAAPGKDSETALEMASGMEHRSAPGKDSETALEMVREKEHRLAAPGTEHYSAAPLGKASETAHRSEIGMASEMGHRSASGKAFEMALEKASEMEHRSDR